APDPFPLVVALIGHVVLADVTLGPVALAVLEVVLAADQEGPDPVATLTGHDSLVKGQEQLHVMAAGPVIHQEEAAPGPGGEPRVGLGEGLGVEWGVRRLRGHRDRSPRGSGGRLGRAGCLGRNPSCPSSLVRGPAWCQAAVMDRRRAGR